MRCEVDFPLEAGGRLRGCFERPREVLAAHTPDEVVAVLATAWQHAQAGRWVVGFVAYEAAPAFDPAFVVAAPHPVAPLAQFGVYDDIAAPVDPAADGGCLASPEKGISFGHADFSCDLWRDETLWPFFDAQLVALHGDIRAGRYYQTNLTTRLRASFGGAPHAYFAALKNAQPDGYCAYLDGGNWQVLSVSPELFFSWTPAGRLTTRPMKGTAPRGADASADAAAAAALSASAKERAENLMIVDLLRNDLGRIAVTGSVAVPHLFAVEPLPTAWQMTSTVTAATRPGTTLVDVFRALFPCGSVTGAPKVAAMAAIARHETSPRGVYCGTIGLLQPGGAALFNVAIRTVTVCDGRVECGIGSGITADATAAGEYAEWQVKRRFLWRAGAPFMLLETLRLEGGSYWLLDGHLQRLATSAAHFGFVLDIRMVRAALEANAVERAARAWRVRLLVARDGAVQLESVPLDSLPTSPEVALAAAPLDGSDEFLRHKTTQRAAYASRALPDVFDTLLFNERDEITEFTRGNVVVELGKHRLTPPVAAGLLPGVWRAKMLAAGEVEEATVMRADLAEATALWFVNSVRGSVPVRLRQT